VVEVVLAPLVVDQAGPIQVELAERDMLLLLVFQQLLR